MGNNSLEKLAKTWTTNWTSCPVVALQESTFCYPPASSRHQQHGSRHLTSLTWSVYVPWTLESRTPPSPPAWWVHPKSWPHYDILLPDLGRTLPLPHPLNRVWSKQKLLCVNFTEPVMLGSMGLFSKIVYNHDDWINSIQNFWTWVPAEILLKIYCVFSQRHIGPKLCILLKLNWKMCYCTKIA